VNLQTRAKELGHEESPPHPLVRISMISLLQSLSLKLVFNSLLYDRNIFGVLKIPRQSSGIFGNLREMSGTVRVTFGKSSESGRKSSENQDVYIIKKISP